jgi:6-carboxyhexanoate--CoA ligase
MNTLWSIRMRASREEKKQNTRIKSRAFNFQISTSNIQLHEVHISGTEGLYGDTEIQGTVTKFIERALNHSRGIPDKIVVTLEQVRVMPVEIQALPVVTVRNTRPLTGRKTAGRLLNSMGISDIAVKKAFTSIEKGTGRGAAVLTARNGRRGDPDHKRGIRASRLGITPQAIRILSSRLSRHGINTETVKEALILASKVASCRDVIAEVCVSDDPDYTTGYVASKSFGYIRIPHLKRTGNKTGGRVFFIRHENMIKEIIEYLEKTPVIVTGISDCRGTVSPDEILNNTDR